jgi:2-polyprenyl-3-methyl-5-hydroxy-6-metoxy-1,4-benzoquinol methylase
MKCRHCQSPLTLSLLDLGSAPPSNAYLTEATLHAPEKWFPLRVLVCQKCWLAQTEDFAQADELFSADYAYFSATSSTWLAHARRYVARMVERFNLNADSFVIEVAANDGYLLQYMQARQIPCMGIEPTASTASVARSKGLDMVESFFGVRLADELRASGKQADVMAANNVLAHVPDINDFTAGFARLLKPHGVATFEFPHLLRLLAACQFDTVYHEHYSYLSLIAVQSIFTACGLTVFDVEEHSTHGGSLRVFACRSDAAEHCSEKASLARVEQMLKKELDAGMNTIAFYHGFQSKAESIKNEFSSFLLTAKKQGRKVAGYGAAAKGNTLINFAGIRSDLLPYVVDRSASKKGKYLPGSRIPIVDESRLGETRPDYIIIFPWNIKNEIMEQLSYARAWGAQFVTAVPSLELQ